MNYKKSFRQLMSNKQNKAAHMLVPVLTENTNQQIQYFYFGWGLLSWIELYVFRFFFKKKRSIYKCNGLLMHYFRDLSLYTWSVEQIANRLLDKRSHDRASFLFKRAFRKMSKALTQKWTSHQKPLYWDF